MSEMNGLAGEIGELSFVIEVKRKETGLVETFNMVGKLMKPDEQIQEKEE